METWQILAFGLSYAVVGATFAGLLVRFGVFDACDEENFAHIWFGLLWPGAILLGVLAVTVGKPLSWLYDRTAGRS